MPLRRYIHPIMVLTTTITGHIMDMDLVEEEVEEEGEEVEEVDGVIVIA